MFFTLLVFVAAIIVGSVALFIFPQKQSTNKKFNDIESDLEKILFKLSDFKTVMISESNNQNFATMFDRFNSFEDLLKSMISMTQQLNDRVNSLKEKNFENEDCTKIRELFKKIMSDVEIINKNL